MRRIIALVADLLLFAYAASWLVLGSLALLSPEARTLSGAVSVGTSLLAISLCVVLRARAGDRAAVRAVVRIGLLFGVFAMTNGLGAPASIITAAGARPLFAAVASVAGGVLDVPLGIAYVWLPLRPHWLLFAGLLHFTAIFPQPLDTTASWRRAMTRPALLWSVAVALTLAWALVQLWLPRPAVRAFFLVTNWSSLPLAALVVMNLRLGYRTATPGERGRILGMVVAVIVALAGEVPYHLWTALGTPTPPAIVTFPHLVAPAAAFTLIAYAVFVRGGLAPELVLKRTALYGLLSVSGLFTFALLDELVSSVLVGQLGLPEGFGATLALAAVAVLFKPVHDRLAVWLNRVLAPYSPPVEDGVVTGVETDPVS